MDNRKSRRAEEARMRRLRTRHAKKFAAAYAPLVALQESLTPPYLEDWLLLCDGETIHCAASREIDGRAFGRFGEASMANFKSMPFASLRGRPAAFSWSWPALDCSGREAFLGHMCDAGGGLIDTQPH
jgi:hypothetical protein